MKNKGKRLRLHFYRFILNVRSIPIFIKFILNFSFIISLMAIIFYFNFSYFANDKTNTAISILLQANVKAISDIDFFITEMENRTILPAIIQSETDFGSYLEVFNLTNEIHPDFHRVAVRIFDQIRGYNLYSYKKQSDYLHSALLYNLQGFYDYKLYGNSYISTQSTDESKKDWFIKCIENHGASQIVGTQTLPNIVDNNNNVSDVFSVARGIIDIDTGKVMGVFLVNANVDYFKNICSNMLISKSQEFIIVDRVGKLIYASNKISSNPKAYAEILTAVNSSQNNSFYLKVNGVHSLLSFNSSKTTGIKLINIIPLNEFNKDLNTMKKRTFFVVLIIICFSFMFVFSISKQIVKPLKKMVVLMKLFEKGDFDQKINIKTNDEVGTLAKSINNMSKKIKILIKEVYQDKIMQKDLELQMLQIQINPHFLYNTLESIHMMAEINNDLETSKMTRSLGKILRYGISNNKLFVPLSEELEQLQEYISLHEVRFAHIFRVLVKVDTDILDCSIIKLLLQPILENAINHGLKDISRNGIIEILGYKEDSSVIFEVVDNGKGMLDEHTARLNDYINGLNDSFSSIGLKNVNRRIKLNYGDEFGIVISSTLNVGTKVKITIPYMNPLQQD